MVQWPESNLLFINTVSGEGVSNIVELHGDAMEQIQKSIDRAIREGAAHATVVITYPGGQQVIISPSVRESDALKVVGFR